MENDSGLNSREKRNLYMFIFSYILNNLVSGILYDTYVNYLQEVSVSIATSFWAFYGYATFISAAILIFVPKTGYKKLLIFCSVSCAAALFSVVFVKSESIFYFTTLLSLVGVQLHYIMLAPFVAAYTGTLKDKSIDWYTRAYYTGYVGYFLTTYLGGVFVVKMFALRAGESYSVAKEMTAYITDVAPEVKMAYVQGNEDVLLIVGIISLLALIPVFLIKEKKEDYIEINHTEKKSFSERAKEISSVLLNKDAVTYLVYWMIISFAMGLFTSYFTVFLNRNLHIDKATSSLLVSISYLAIVLFMLFTPFVVRKLGKVGTNVFTVLMSVPFMLMIANGDKFGNAMIPVVGLALFMRAGLANLGAPAESDLMMSITPKALRPAYTSIVNFIAGIISIISGTFTGKFLFIEQEGYKDAYYIAAVLYIIAAVIMFVGLRKYNRKNGEEA